MNIGVIILAAGEGKRFGGDKLFAKIDNIPIIMRTIGIYEDLEKVIIVGKYVNELLPLLMDQIVIYNPFWKEGISTSIKLGLRFFKNYDAVLVALGDMPFVTKDDVNKIISAFKPSCKAVIPTHKGEKGNPVLISKSLFDEIEKLRGDVGAKVILNKMRMEELCFVECSEGVLIDIDKKEDLMRLGNFHP
ncbi:MAG: NTP transferase domain-containing protein [Saccharolobus sp.]|uniref:nucleotidyltransferase family protein n=1 Tax=Saccharolobus TaxID=2100760 RepID=UPI001F0F3AA3|nr:NTP transferase domain-containing protein [Saccharolobus shibatae]MCH4815321.1 NTP transferase domain-containing protein [Saccharolobus shibatae]